MSINLELFSDMKNYTLIRNEWTAGPVLYSAFICITKQTAQNRPSWFLMHINVCFMSTYEMFFLFRVGRLNRSYSESSMLDHLWSKVNIEPLTKSELEEVGLFRML